MKIKLNKIVKLLTILSFALLSITDAIYVSRGINNIIVSLKYIPVIIVIGLYFLSLIKNYKNNINNFNLKLINLIYIFFSFFLISLLQQVFSGIYSYNTYIILFKFILGVLFVYSIINLLNFDDIYRIMYWILLFSIIGYILQVGINNITLSNIKSMNFSLSYSPLESHFFSSTFLVTTTFYSYYRRNKIPLLISFLFTILAFKRLQIIFSIIIFIIPFFLNVNKKINKKILYIIPIIFVFITIMYHWILQPPQRTLFIRIFNDTPEQFTSGRNTRLNIVESEKFNSYGIGSAANELGLEMIEMDLIEIYIELSIIGLIIFICIFWSLNSGSIYCTLFMTFLLFDFLMSGGFSNCFSWTRNILIIYSISCINDKKYIGKNINEDQNLLRGEI